MCIVFRFRLEVDAARTELAQLRHDLIEGSTLHIDSGMMDLSGLNFMSKMPTLPGMSTELALRGNPAPKAKGKAKARATSAAHAAKASDDCCGPDHSGKIVAVAVAPKGDVTAQLARVKVLEKQLSIRQDFACALSAR